MKWLQYLIVLASALPVHAASVEGLNTDVYLTVTPRPKEETYRDAYHRVTRPALIAEKGADDARLIGPFTGYLQSLGLEPQADASDCDLLIRLRVRRDGDPSHPQPDNLEGYTLSIAPAAGRVEATIIGNGLKGAQHGLQSLRQLMMEWEGGIIIREAQLVDWPDVPYRYVKRASNYWMDMAVQYKMNGGTGQDMLPQEGDGKQEAMRLRDWVDAARERNLYLLNLVNMGHVYRGSEEAVERAEDYYVGLHELGVTHLAVMNDDKMALADAAGRERFGGYYEAQLYYLTRIDAALREAGYERRLGFVPNSYHGERLDPMWKSIAGGKLPPQTALFLAGDHKPGIPVTVEQLSMLRDQVGAQHLWYYTNWPQVDSGFMSSNYGATRHHDFGPGTEVELVTVSTSTTPETFPTSYITMCDRLWNTRDYDPDVALQRATKEVVPPEAYDAFYAWFKYTESIAPYPTVRMAGPLYMAGTVDECRAILETMGETMNQHVKACLETSFGRQDDIKKELEWYLGRKDALLKQLADEAQREQQGMPFRTIACPLVAEAPKLDGRLDDPVWQQAAVADRFTDRGGEKLAPHQTTVRVLRTKDHLYFAVRSEEPHLDHSSFLDLGLTYPKPIDERPAARLWWNETIELFLDPGRDRKKFYQLFVNPWGAHASLLIDGDTYGWHNLVYHHDFDFLPVTGAVDRLSDAWVLEFAIPLSAFGDERSLDTWGFNVTRTRKLGVGDGITGTTWTPLNWGHQDSRNFGQMIMEK